MTCIEVMLFTRRRHFHHTFHVIFALHISFQNDMDHILNLLLFVLLQINKGATIQYPRVCLSQIIFFNPVLRRAGNFKFYYMFYRTVLKVNYLFNAESVRFFF